MNPYEELSELIGEAADAWLMSGHRVKGSSPEGESAKAVLAAGYRKPRTITTVTELDALPVGSVILSGGKIPRIKSEDGNWLGDGIDVDSAHIIRYTNFATVVHEPTA